MKPYLKLVPYLFLLIACSTGVKKVGGEMMRLKKVKIYFLPNNYTATNAPLMASITQELAIMKIRSISKRETELFLKEPGARSSMANKVNVLYYNVLIHEIAEGISLHISPQPYVLNWEKNAFFTHQYLASNNTAQVGRRMAEAIYDLIAGRSL
jgi:hypothetical protein